MDSISLYEWALSKAAGDRGGHVIGHTSSGKPVYAASHAYYGRQPKGAKKITHSPYTHFGDNEHDEAEALHTKHAEMASDRGDSRGAKLSARAAKIHGHLAQTRRDLDI